MTAKIKLNAASGGGSISIQAPSSSSNNRVISLPDIADGTLLTSQSSLDSTKLSPAISAGITMQDSWVITANASVNSEADITSNWAKHSAGSSAQGNIGTGMTESSGIFTFPSTGIYFVTSTLVVQANGGRTYIGMRQKFTTDGSNFTENITGYTNAYQNSAYGSVTIIGVFDVTNTSTHKIKFQHNLSDTVLIIGNSSQKHTGATFTRLGDT